MGDGMSSHSHSHFAHGKLSFVRLHIAGINAGAHTRIECRRLRARRKRTNQWANIFYIGVFPRGCSVGGADTAGPLAASMSAGEQMACQSCSKPHFWAGTRHNCWLKVSVRAKQDSSGPWDFPFSSTETLYGVRAFKEGFLTAKSRQGE
jgi:hypothetical protein